ncbi:MAG: hypothetical protein ACRCX2_34765 [Paraclostridium sp.]
MSEREEGQQELVMDWEAVFDTKPELTLQLHFNLIGLDRMEYTIRSASEMLGQYLERANRLWLEAERKLMRNGEAPLSHIVPIAPDLTIGVGMEFTRNTRHENGALLAFRAQRLWHDSIYVIHFFLGHALETKNLSEGLYAMRLLSNFVMPLHKKYNNNSEPVTILQDSLPFIRDTSALAVRAMRHFESVLIANGIDQGSIVLVIARLLTDGWMWFTTSYSPADPRLQIPVASEYMSTLLDYSECTYLLELRNNLKVRIDQDILDELEEGFVRLAQYAVDEIQCTLDYVQQNQMCFDALGRAIFTPRTPSGFVIFDLLSVAIISLSTYSAILETINDIIVDTVGKGHRLIHQIAQIVWLISKLINRIEPLARYFHIHRKYKDFSDPTGRTRYFPKPSFEASSSNTAIVGTAFGYAFHKLCAVATIVPRLTPSEAQNLIKIFEESRR